MKTGIVLVGYGTTVKTAEQKSYLSLADEIQTLYSNELFALVYTGNRIRQALRDRGEMTEDLPNVLERFAASGITDLYLFSTHLQHGTEYQKILDTVRQYANRFRYLTVTPPLLCHPNDVEKVGAAVMEQIFPSVDTLLGIVHDRKDAEPQLVEQRLADGRKLLLCSLSDEIVQRLPLYFRKTGSDKVGLTAFTFTAGKHLMRDVMGTHPESVMSVLQDGGLRITAIDKGLGEYPAVRRLLLERLERLRRQRLEDVRDAVCLSPSLPPVL